MKNPTTILEAISYWLNFEYACGREELFSERHLSYPIGQFLMSRYGRMVRTEYNHPILDLKRKKSGNPPKIDFVVINEGNTANIDLAIETKWISKSGTLARDIWRDILRLFMILDNHDCSAYLIVAGKKSRMSNLFSKKTLSSFPIANTMDQRKLDLKKGYAEGDNFILSVLETFEGVEIPNFIYLKQIAVFDHNLRDAQYPIFGWRIMKKRVNKFIV